MLNVVSDTTPLISLMKLNHLEILKDLYNEIYIPNAVYKEIEFGKNKKYYKDLSLIKWINIVEILNKDELNFLKPLDSGEAEAIILAKELKSDLIIIDEKIGRYYANNAHLKVTGTLGILLKAKRLGLIIELKPLLNELTSKGVWIERSLIQEVLMKADEI